MSLLFTKQSFQMEQRWKIRSKGNLKSLSLIQLLKLMIMLTSLILLLLIEDLEVAEAVEVAVEVEVAISNKIIINPRKTYNTIILNALKDLILSLLMKSKSAAHKWKKLLHMLRSWYRNKLSRKQHAQD